MATQRRSNLPASGAVGDQCASIRRAGVERDADWFERAYRLAAAGGAQPPWFTGSANEHLVAWPEIRPLVALGGSALVVGCGYGEDAAWLDEQGFTVTGLDISPTAVAIARRRASNVSYVAGDAESLPFVNHAFSLVLDIYTMQCIPRQRRARVAESMVGALAPAGAILVVATVATQVESADAPWTLEPRELEIFERLGLRPQTFERFVDPKYPHLQRIRASYSSS